MIKKTMLVSLVLAVTPGTALAQMSHDQHTGPAMNFLRISDTLATGGHFVGDGLDELRHQGVAVVIDLRDKPPAGQGHRLAEAGIRWINIPVVWDSPQVGDFANFREAMDANRDASVLVQCQANYRASAFTYMYRVLEGGVPEGEAREAMTAVWSPEGTWEKYIADVFEAFDHGAD